jgi:hypothetical protein
MVVLWERMKRRRGEGEKGRTAGEKDFPFFIFYFSFVIEENHSNRQMANIKCQIKNEK